MFASLKTGDLAICYYHLSEMNTDKAEVRHALTTYTVAMRQNLAAGNPIFTGIRKLEEEIENCAAAAVATDTDTDTDTNAPLPHDDEELMTPCAPRSRRARRVPAMSENDPNYKIERDNAALAEIFAKELAFLNRTIQLISLVASRYHEEQEDIAWDYNSSSWGGHSDIETADELGGEYGQDDEYYDDDGVPSAAGSAASPPAPLTRSQSHSFGDENIKCADYFDPRPKNQLANTLLVGSGQFQQHFLSLCLLAGTDIVDVNAMTTLDRPITESSFERKQRATVSVMSSIYTEFNKYDADNRASVVRVFQTLRDLSSATWSMMSMLAFSNLFRLTHGTDFETAPINPDDAIFSNQGRPFRPRMGFPAAMMPDTLRTHCDEEAAAVGAEATTTTTDE
jgi:hypothetical protein